ncbi:hypothetical protein [Aeromicrobium chenweiae]|uniref:Uncharacterized protein n=1 Tax=Aeromicrobium chenweiae TaxID=2079793 RepID=A0A2S0WNU3_9ACTN|nr:hypothetical protein [Aeromicrobium chenweiae]AWB93005.1 hypothetical protein C3E78_12755 [Aeromicrobium chenweiae]TGN33995.1 hypothetical protein E4L97_02795 [Aeromicrobium chenweiae]
MLGVLLVLGATVLGARLAATSDDTVEYWSLKQDVRPGDPVVDGDLTPTRVRLSGGAAGNYVRTDEEFAAPLDQLVWAHDMASGSLVGKDALVARSTQSRSQLPLSVTDGAAPADLARGDLVDVWVGPGPGDEPTGKAVRVLESVRVLQTGGEAAAASGSLAQTVLVDVAREQMQQTVISTVAAGHVTLVRVS